MAKTETKSKTWSYQGVDSLTAKSVSGKVQANGEEEALEAVTANGVIPLNVSPVSSTNSLLSREMHLKPKSREVALFIRGYSTAASSNMRTEDALRIAAAGVSSPSLKQAAEDIMDKYANGTPLDEAFAEYSGIFGEGNGCCDKSRRSERSDLSHVVGVV